MTRPQPPARPLQLLEQALAFIDPVTQATRQFESRQPLRLPARSG